MKATAQTRAEELVEILTEASDAYYNGGNSKLSDAEFDRLKDELESIDPSNPFLATIGAPVDDDSKLTKVKHEIPMGSLKKINYATGENEYATWRGSAGIKSNTPLMVTWKLDGSSIELIYKNGIFVQAITRGDGIIGEDVTHSIKNAKGFPHKLKEPLDISIRAEAILRLDDWNKHLSKIRNDAGELPSNPRNVAAGLCRRSNGKDSEYLHCVAFNVVGGFKWDTLLQKYTWLKSNGFEVVHYKIVTTSDVKHHVDTTLSERDKLIYEIDGLVIALNGCSDQDALGEKDGIPYWARAWKFPAQGGVSKLLNVSWDVGTRGIITPVAHVNPVSVGGVKITNVTLHNMNEIDRLGLQTGDEVEVVRAGDVIPKITRVIKPGSLRVKITCDKCPACGGKVHLDGPFLHCSDPEHCIGVQNKRIMKWIKKREIMYLGDSALDKLIAAKAVSSVRDIYFLTVPSMVAAGIGEGMAKKILAEIQKSMNVTLSDLIGSLSIDLLGRSQAETIVEGGFVTVKMWRDMQEADLLKLGGFQMVKAGRIYKSLRQNWKIIEELAGILQVQEGLIKPKSKNKGSLSGLSFCFTGTMEKPRKELQKLVDDSGGDNWDHVSSGLSYLVMEDPNSDSTKAKKARSLGVKTISESDFLRMIGK